MPGLAHGAWTPKNLGSCILWLKANSISTLNPATWPNLAATGSAGDATQASAPARPTLEIGVIAASHRSLSFDGVNTFMSGSVPIPAGATKFAAFYVARTSTVPTAFASVMSSGGSGAGSTPSVRWMFGLGTDAGQGAGWAGPATGVSLGAVTGIAASTRYIGGFYLDGTNWHMSGINTGVVADSSFPTGGTFNYCIGHEGASYTNYAFPGSIAEVIILMQSSAISALDLASVTDYLTREYP